MRLLGFCALAVSATALAADVQVRSVSVLTGSPELTQPNQVQTLVPLYELVGLSARRLEVPGFDDFGVAFDAWGSFLPGGSTVDGDVNVAYLEGLTLKKHLRLRAGRQLIVGGTARMMAVDGLFAEASGLYGFGINAFVGNPVERRFSNFTHGDLAAGSRLFFSPSTDLQAGISLTYVGDRGAIVRNDVGVDARWYAGHGLNLAGALLYSLPEQRLAEIDLGPRWQPIPQVEVLAGWRRTAPDLFLPRNSIFTVFAENTRDQLGGTVTWQALKLLSLTGDAEAIWLDQQNGYDTSLSARLSPSRTNATSVTAQLRKLSIPVNGYTQGRLAARHTLPIGVVLFADLDLYQLDQPIRYVRTSFSFSGGATYAISRQWSAGFSFMHGHNPYFDSHEEVMLKLSYLFPEALR